jgi:hypothetical protein
VPYVKAVVVLLTSAAVFTRAHAAPFENLGFDNPKEFKDWGVGSTADVLPGWELWHNNVPQTTVGFNDTYIFTSDNINVTLYDAKHTYYGVEGLYGLSISAGRSDSFTLVQRGDIPVDTPYLEIRKAEYDANVWHLTINGEPITRVRDTINGLVTPGQTGLAFFDISQFAGRNVELRLTTPVGWPGWSTFWLDSLQFVQDIPEPQTGILTIGGLALLLIRYRRWLWNARLRPWSRYS